MVARNENLDQQVILKKTAENLAQLNDSNKATEEYVIRKAEEAKRRENILAMKKFRQLHKEKVCPKCGKKLLSFKGLLLHLENHKDESEWKFECQECGKKFAAKNDLRIHLRIHTGETPYKCPYNCGRKYRNRKSYTCHLKFVHADEPGLDEELKKKLFFKPKLPITIETEVHGSKPSCKISEEINTNEDDEMTAIDAV